MEIPRLIEEALLYDDRILAVTNFEIEKKMMPSPSLLPLKLMRACLR